MKQLEAIYHFFDDLATLVRNISPFPQKVYLFYFYLFLKIKGVILIKILGLKIEKQKIFGYTVYFSDFFEFVRIFTDIFIWKLYDFDIMKLKPKIIDCGANIGLASLYFKIRYPSAEIVCFEPSRQAFRLLKKNLALLPGCNLINAALHKYSYNQTILNKPKNSSVTYYGSTLFPTRWKGLNLSKEKVKAVKLSSFIKKNQTIDFLKIDIEGAEKQVLEDLHQTKKIQQIRQMYIEFHLIEKNNSLAEICHILNQNEFRVIVSGGVRPPFPVYKNKFYFLHLFAYRN